MMYDRTNHTLDSDFKAFHEDAGRDADAVWLLCFRCIPLSARGALTLDSVAQPAPFFAITYTFFVLTHATATVKHSLKLIEFSGISFRKVTFLNGKCNIKSNICHTPHTLA